MKSNGRNVREQLRLKIILKVQFKFRTTVLQSVMKKSEPLHYGHLHLTPNFIKKVGGRSKQVLLYN